MGLTKLTIYSYKDEDLSQPNGSPLEAYINPESYEVGFSIAYKESDEVDSPAGTMRFSHVPSSDLVLTFIVDGTVPIHGDGQYLNVEAYIASFKTATYEYIGSTHEPPFLKLSWGKLEFNCVLVSMKITYSLFKADGTVLRATIKASFNSTESQRDKAAEAAKQSPDLTHKVTVVAGDTLPGLSYRIYGKSDYYLDIARVNGLKNIRMLKPGTSLLFPPLK